MAFGSRAISVGLIGNEGRSCPFDAANWYPVDPVTLRFLGFPGMIIPGARAE